MNKFFRLVSMFAIAGVTFAYTSCTDYSEDIDKANSRIDEVQTEIEGKIAKVNEQITGINTTINELKAADKATNDAIESLKQQDAALQTAIANLKKAHDADVKALTEKYDALKKSVDGNTAKISELTTQFTNQLAELDKAYKDADAKLQDQITVNKQSIATLQADVKKINEETVPALNARIDELQKYADDKFATKEELTAQANKTAEEIKAVNELIGGLTSRLDAVDTRLKSLDSDLKAISEKCKTFEDQIKALQDKDTELAGLIAIAKDAADNAQKDATKALSEIAAIQDALEGYTEKGAIMAKFEELVAADLAAAARLGNLDDSIADITNKIKQLFANDAKMADEIATLFEQKFNKSEFAAEFKKAYEARFQSDFNAAFDSAWVSKFQPALDAAFDKAWDDKFDAKFGGAFSEALGEAVKTGIIYKAIEEAKGDVTAAQEVITNALGERITNLDTYVKNAESALNSKITNLTTQYTELKTYTETQVTTLTNAILKYYGEAMDAFYQNLRSLVYIPELYVGGIESVEYIYASYSPLYPPVALGEPKSEPEYVELLWGDGDEEYNKCLISTENWYMYEPMRDGDYEVSSYINPLVAVSYQMNPSSAVIKATDKFAFDTRDVEAVRSSIAFDGDKPEAKVLSSENGILKVGINALGQRANQNPRNQVNEWSMTDNISVFALQAYVKTKEGKDTVVTSDYARLYANEMRFCDLAFEENSEAVSTFECELGYKLYPCAAAAICNVPSLRVKYDGQLDLHDVVRTHIAIISPTNKNGTHHVVYEDKFPENDYNVEYQFQLIDYKTGVNETSQSQHAYLSGEDNCIFTPCGTTNGVRDYKTDLTSVGRRPLVRVTLVDKATDQVILVGFIKIEIVREVAAVTADPFEWTFDYACENGHTFTWDEVVDNILKKTNLTREEFAKLYVLEKNNGVACQYGYVNGELTEDVVPLGKVTEVLDLAGRPFGSTTDVLTWSLDASDMDRIYKSEGHKATTYVRFVLRGTSEAHSSIYEGIYVPLVATVTKIQGTDVAEKIDQYWFDNGTKAKINVRVPNTIGADGTTLDWTTNINQVWVGGTPKFGETIDKLIEDNKASYKYYFAPVQPEYEIDGKNYRLYVKNDFVEDLYEKDAQGNAKKFTVTKNESISDYELANSLDIREGIYVNYTLFCDVIEDGKVVSKGVKIASFVDLDQYPHSTVKYYDDNEVAKTLLNAYPANDPKLFANIGVAVYLRPCYVTLSVKDAVNPYYFLRPISVASVNTKSFTDGEDVYAAGSNINVIDLITLTDWRGKDIVANKYLKFYGVKGIKVDVDNATTNLNNGNILTTRLFPNDEEEGVVKPGLIQLEYRASKDFKNVTTFEKNYNFFGDSVKAGWSKTELTDALGHIHYHNNGNNVDEFKIRIPVEVEYDWGWISNTYVEITVKKTTVK